MRLRVRPTPGAFRGQQLETGAGVEVVIGRIVEMPQSKNLLLRLELRPSEDL